MKLARSRRVVAAVAAAGWLALLVAACGGGPDAKAPPSNCGGPVFLDKRCEALACGACAPEMSACAANDSCNRLAHCMLGCKHNLSETCGMLCIHGEPGDPEGKGPAARLGLGLYHAMLGCTGRASLPECGPDS